VKGVLEGKTKKRAAQDAGYAKSTAENAKEKIESTPAVQSMFVTLLEQAGVSDALLAQRIKEGLSATDVKTANFEGKISDVEAFVAYAERRSMVELVLKLKGHLIDKHELRMTRTLEEILEGSHE